MMEVILVNEEATLALGTRLGTACRKEGAIIFLQGALGAGKTTLARGILQALGHQGTVKSPTYTLVEPYLLNQQLIYHFDLYRLTDPRELEFMGIQDYFAPGVIALVEWPERAFDWLPPADLQMSLEHLGSRGRSVRLEAKTERGQHLLHPNYNRN
ncbi:tRNA (adenosine(37)-N6)-threonylcarbamoyltransferase complex ATPase subunit type 1 TsaE [Nitrosococcus watsonii]|uniref:tRNA threonylcarbamoyladenosine biosynthesis protein TsaE n=1 Tax=Nitrosococcus watsoni (strain C-113) TaxID=105559 RepID=D8KAV6_NITWC|nr:tRNA (adenosine(37)-N6)-threonylcarbamoyltransferase complex ATPase subunit type 1 TsaE [Nitrosococcus watsonii]ADJ29533.1 protein of unknown function UPF0079 [Nitrosococcus watsonii C-113]